MVTFRASASEMRLRFIGSIEEDSEGIDVGEKTNIIECRRLNKQILNVESSDKFSRARAKMNTTR